MPYVDGGLFSSRRYFAENYFFNCSEENRPRSSRGKLFVTKKLRWAMVVVELVEWSLTTPEARGLNPISDIIEQFSTQRYFLKYDHKGK